jgi:hypothetical protein
MKIYGLLLIVSLTLTIRAQNFEREFPLAENASIKITNLYGRVSVVAEKIKPDDDAEEKTDTGKALLTAPNAKEADLKIISETKRLEIIVQPTEPKSRIDLTLKISANSKINIETAGGEVRIEGDIESAEIKTDTGTIAANVPLDDLKYHFVWTEARPRFLSDIVLEEVDEKAGGKFVVNGRLGEKEKGRKEEEEVEKTSEVSEKVQEQEAANDEHRTTDKRKRPKTKDRKP